MLTELGLGASSLGNLYSEISDESAFDTVEASWSLGIRYFDTAPYYGLGLSELRLGNYLRKSNKIDYIISTKVGRLLYPSTPSDDRYGFIKPLPNDFVYDYSYDGIMRSFETSLARLGVDCIDILLMHDIGVLTHGEKNKEYFRIAMSSGYRALDELRSAGKIAAIGLGVNEIEVCEQALNFGDWDCFLLAGRYTLLEQGGVTDFLPKCAQRGTSLIVGGIYNSGILASGTRGRILNYDYGAPPLHILARVQKIEDICHSHGVSLPAAALQFPLFHPVVTAVVPGTGKPERVKSFFDQYKAEIPSSFWSDMKMEGLLHPAAPIDMPIVRNNE